MELRLAKEVEIDSAHYLNNYNGKCAFMHGHRWKIRVEIVSVDPDLERSNGMLVDFKKISGYFDQFDHALMQETAGAAMSERSIELGFNPTAENLALHWAMGINDMLKDELFGTGNEATVSKITVWETPDSEASWIF